jgi:hypothetical protein
LRLAATQPALERQHSSRFYFLRESPAELLRFSRAI